MSIYFLLGFVGSFVGTLPLGPINLSVVKITIRDGLKAALQIILAAVLVELLYSFISLHCTDFIVSQLTDHAYIGYMISVAFIAAGLFLLIKSFPTNKSKVGDLKKNSFFIQGLSIALFNPQAIPFWVFVIGWYKMEHWIPMQRLGWTAMLVFVIGAALGKLLSLYLFSYLSHRLESKLQRISKYMNKIIGLVLLVIGLSQLV